MILNVKVNNMARKGHTIIMPVSLGTKNGYWPGLALGSSKIA
jgi:hypothetical protein